MHDLQCEMKQMNYAQCGAIQTNISAQWKWNRDIMNVLKILAI